MDSTSIDSRLRFALDYKELLEGIIARKELFIADEQLNHEENARKYECSWEEFEGLAAQFEQKYPGVPFIDYSKEDIIKFLTVECDMGRFLYQRDTSEIIVGYERDLVMPLLLEQREKLERLIGDYLQSAPCTV